MNEFQAVFILFYIILFFSLWIIRYIFHELLCYPEAVCFRINVFVFQHFVVVVVQPIVLFAA